MPGPTPHTSRDCRSFLPDASRVESCRRQPENGPRILFFSGGSALRGLSRALTGFTHNSIHLITPFDSGGSSAHLRRAFAMPSVGDIRNRLISLAAPGEIGSPTFRLLAHRLSGSATPHRLAEEFRSLANGRHDLVRELPATTRETVRSAFAALLERLPAGFDLRSASVGNLFLTANYLACGRDIHAAIEEMGRLLQVKGTVFPIADADVQLAATLADGSSVVGQHRLTGKETNPLTSPISDLYLVDGEARRTEVSICERARELIARADLACFPMGSFHTSVRANLLPTGVGRTLRANSCAKIYIPNTGRDPEQVGMSVESCLEKLTALAAREDSAGDRQPIDLVILDESANRYDSPLDPERIAASGVDVLTADLVTAESAPRLDDRRLAELLISLT